MRDYAGLRLREAGEEDAIGEPSAEYYRLRSQRAGSAARFHLVEWLEWMDLEIDNVRSALRRFLNRGDYDSGIDLAISLRYYWITRATTEGVRWLDELLSAGGSSPDLLARAYYLRRLLGLLQGDTAPPGRHWSAQWPRPKKPDSRIALAGALVGRGGRVHGRRFRVRERAPQ